MGTDRIEKCKDFFGCCNGTISCICATLALPRLLFHFLHLQGITHIAAVIKAAYISGNATVSRNFMRPFLIILVVTIISCNSQQDTKSNSDVTLVKSKKAILPRFVQDYLSSNLHGWTLASNDKWDDMAFKKYSTDTSRINYVLTDINCDGKFDFTGILQDSTGNFATFQIYSFDQYYVSRQLESYGDKKKINFGLKLIDAKTPFKHYDGSSETFKCGAVERFNLNNGGKKIFYANEKGFFEIEVGE
jgi:hypothetical protein